MDNMILFYYVIPIGLVSLGFGLYFILKTGRRPRDKKPNDNNTEAETAPPVEVFLYKTARVSDFGFTFISQTDLDKINNPGPLREYRDKSTYHLNQYTDEAGNIQYRSVDSLIKPTREKPPWLVHYALNTPQVEVVWDVKRESTLLQKLTPVLIFCGSMAFIMWMWSTG